MVTQREYLVGLGLASPGRGRFSKDAHAALNKALSEGMKFTDGSAPAPTVVDAGDAKTPEPETPREYGVPLLRVGGHDHKVRDIRSLTGVTADGHRIGFDTCRRCLGHLTLCSCKSPRGPVGVVSILDLPDWKPVG